MTLLTLGEERIKLWKYKGQPYNSFLKLNSSTKL